MRHRTSSIWLFSVAAALAACLLIQDPALSRGLTFSTDLADDPFFIAHRDAAIVADRLQEPWDLSWAAPPELQDQDQWRAAVASLPPASLKAAEAKSTNHVDYIGWPPIAVPN